MFNDMCKDELDVEEDRLDDMCDEGLVSLRFLNTTSESSFDSPTSLFLYESFTLFSGAEVESSCWCLYIPLLPVSSSNLYSQGKRQFFILYDFYFGKIIAHI